MLLMIKVTKTDGEKRVQTLIKNQLDDLEQSAFWGNLDPALINTIRHKIIRTAFGAYKVGLTVEANDTV